MSSNDRYLESKGHVWHRCGITSLHGRLGGVVWLCLVLAFGWASARADEEEPALRLAAGSTHHSIPLAPAAAEAVTGHIRAISLHDDTLAVLIAPERGKSASLVQISLTTGEMVRQFDLAVAGADDVYLRVTEDAVWILFRDTGRLVRCDFSGELKQEFTVLPEKYTSVNGQYFDGDHWWIFATRRNQYGLWRLDPESGEQTPEFEVPQFSRSILGIVGLSFAAENLAQVVVEEMLDGKRNVVVYSRQLFQENGSVTLDQNRATSDGYRSTWQPDNAARILDVRGTRHADKWLYQVRDLPEGRQSGLLVRLGNFHRPREGLLISEDSDVAGKVLLDCDEKRVVWMVPGENAVHWINYTKSHWEYPVKIAPERWPTKERPIVRRSDMGRWGIVFGGPDGDERITIEWPKGVSTIGISSDGKWAAAILAGGQRETPQMQVVVFGADGKENRRVDFPRQWVDVPEEIRNLHLRLESKIIMASSEDILVSFGLFRSGHFRSEEDSLGIGETFFIGINGTVKAVGIPNFAREMRLLIKRGEPDGFLITTDEGDRNWDIYRIDASGELLWKRRFHDGGVPSVWPIAHDDPNVDLRIRADGIMFNYTRNGELVE